MTFRSELCLPILADVLNGEPLPSSDLGRLDDEVLSRSPEAALPCNLPDHWLVMIARDLEMLMENGKSTGSGHHISAPAALVAHILLGRTNSAVAAVSIDDLSQMFCDLHIEVSLELIRRSGAVDFEPATLDTILTEARRSS